jgi:hypothetical protein
MLTQSMAFPERCQEWVLKKAVEVYFDAVCQVTIVFWLCNLIEPD